MRKATSADASVALEQLGAHLKGAEEAVGRLPFQAQVALDARTPGGSFRDALKTLVAATKEQSSELSNDGPGVS